MLLLLGLSAHAAQVTDVPPFLRGDVSIGYQLEFQTGGLQEQGADGMVDVGRMTRDAHTLNVGGVFGAGPGVAVYFDVPVTLADTTRWSDAQEMIYDPNLGAGSMANGALLAESPTITGKGAQGVWLGVRGTPFSETLWPNRNSQTTWLLDVGMQTRDSTNYYTVGDDGRGAGTGARALRIRSAWSTQLGSANPYLDATYLRRGTTVVDLRDSSGAVVTAGAQVLNADRMSLRTGIEVTTGANETTQAEFRADFRLGVDYTTWQDIPSGLNLPSTLGSTEGKLVTMGEYSTVSLGLGFYWRMFKYARLDLVGDVHYVMPHRLEHAYLAQTGPDTLFVNGGAKLTILFR